MAVKGVQVVISTTEAPKVPFSGTVFKYGENPAFGPHTPSKVLKMLGPDIDYFLKGRLAENQGMGVASGYTPKPANEGHLKTGQRKRTQDNISFSLNQLFQQDFFLHRGTTVVN